MFPLLSPSAGKAAFDHIIDNVLLDHNHVSLLKSSLQSAGRTEVYDLLSLTESDVDSLSSVKRGEWRLVATFQEFVLMRHLAGNPVGNDWSSITMEEFDDFRYSVLIAPRSVDRATCSFKNQQYIVPGSAASLYERRTELDNKLDCSEEKVVVDVEVEEQTDNFAIKVASMEKSFGNGSFSGVLSMVSYGTVYICHFAEDVLDYCGFYSAPTVLPPGEPPPTVFEIHVNSSGEKGYAAIQYGFSRGATIYNTEKKVCVLDVASGLPSRRRGVTDYYQI